MSRASKQTLRDAAASLLSAVDLALPYAPHRGEFDHVADAADDLRAVLAKQPAPQPLTDYEVLAIYQRWDETPGTSWADFARAVEREVLRRMGVQS